MLKPFLKKELFSFTPEVPPLFLLLYFYIYGIISSRVEGTFFPAFLFGGAVFILVSHLLKARFKILAIFGALLIFGHGYKSMHETGLSKLEEADLLNISVEKVDMQGVLLKVPEKVRFGERLYIKTEKIKSRGISKLLGTVVRVTCYNFHSDLQYGDTVVIKNIRLRKPNNYNNPGGFDYIQYLLDRGIELTGSIRKPAQVIVLKRGDSQNIVALLYKLKKRLTGFINERSDPAVSTFIEATSFGVRGVVSPELRESFSKIGTSHILAVSGLHVGFIILIFFSIFKAVFSLLLIRMNIRSFMLGQASKLAAVFTIPFMSSYVLMVGNSSSSFRAAVMGVIFLLSIILGKEREVFSVIALSAMVLLLDNPARLLEIGFQLSFIALFFIVYGYQKIPSNEPETKNAVSAKGISGLNFFVSCKNLLLVSCLAALGTAPLTAYYFNIVSVISPISNMVIIPLIAIIVPSSILFSLLSLLWESGAALLLIIPAKLSMVVLLLSEGIAKIPNGFFRVSDLEPRNLLLLYILIISALTLVKNGGKGKLARYVFTVLAIFLTFTLFFKKDPLENGSFVVTYLDVGQGNSALLETPSGERLLIDGGGAFGDFDIGRAVVAPFLWKKGVTEIDYVIGSHQDSDHIGGLNFILREFNVKEYIDNGDDKEEVTARILNTLRKKSIFHRVVGKGDTLELASGVKLSFLNPDKSLLAKSKNDNDRGLVIRVSYDDVSLLFSGDISSKIERTVVAGGNVKSTVMDVPHHGSRFSSSREYIKAISPKVVIISVGGRNPFGHPARATLDRYLDYGVKILRTDVNGAVIFESDGKNFSISPTVR